MSFEIESGRKSKTRRYRQKYVCKEKQRSKLLALGVDQLNTNCFWP
jgi:hypothetical protein